jgi:hypothetical protein
LPWSRYGDVTAGDAIELEGAMLTDAEAARMPVSVGDRAMPDPSGTGARTEGVTAVIALDSFS